MLLFSHPSGRVSARVYGNGTIVLEYNEKDVTSQEELELLDIILDRISRAVEAHKTTYNLLAVMFPEAVEKEVEGTKEVTNRHLDEVSIEKVQRVLEIIKLHKKYSKVFWKANRLVWKILTIKPQGTPLQDSGLYMFTPFGTLDLYLVAREDGKVLHIYFGMRPEVVKTPLSLFYSNVESAMQVFKNTVMGYMEYLEEEFRSHARDLGLTNFVLHKEVFLEELEKRLEMLRKLFDVWDEKQKIRRQSTADKN